MENKLLEFQKRIGAIKKDGKNPHFKSSYATLSQILSEVKPILSDLGLTLCQPIINGNVMTVIYDAEKDVARSEIRLPEGLSPQQLGSAITYFRRYTLASLLSLEIEDDDGNSASVPHKKVELIINSDVYKQAVVYLKNGGVLSEIEKKYNVSEKCKESLITDAT